MAKKKKTNPRKRPATVADVRRETAKAKDQAIQYAMAVFLFTMYDKEGWGRKRLRRVWDNVNDLSDSIAKGYVSIFDLTKALEDEAGIILLDD